MSNPDKLLRQSPEADATMAGDRAAIYHRQTRKAITLNPVGTILWQELASPRRREDLVQVILRHWPQVEESTAAADVDKFIEQLQSHELISAE